jgi:hypothetical protein
MKLKARELRKAWEHLVEIGNRERREDAYVVAVMISVRNPDATEARRERAVVAVAAAVSPYGRHGWG